MDEPFFDSMNKQIQTIHTHKTSIFSGLPKQIRLDFKHGWLNDCVISCFENQPLFFQENVRKMSESSDAGEEKKGEGDRSKLIAKLSGRF